MAKITESTRVNDMLKKFPKTKEVLKKHKVDCFGCLGAEQESIRNLAWAHGLDVEAIVKELNDANK